MVDWLNFCDGMLIRIVWIILMIVIAIALIKWIITNSKKDTALQILREQYARGDLSEEEFEQRKQNLKQ